MKKNQLSEIQSPAGSSTCEIISGLPQRDSRESEQVGLKRSRGSSEILENPRRKCKKWVARARQKLKRVEERGSGEREERSGPEEHLALRTQETQRKMQ